MIQAEHILLHHALMDPLNERFVFLSDSCIPLYNFSYTYDYIISTPNGFVDSFADTKEDRYNPKMDPLIPVQSWRKGSQWAVLNRKHADIVVKDERLFPMFQLHCKNELLPVAHINQLLADKLFRIQLQRSSSRTPDKNAGSLVLLSYTEKPTMFLPEESTSVSGAKRIREEESILVTDAKATKKRKSKPSTLPKPQ